MDVIWLQMRFGPLLHGGNPSSGDDVQRASIVNYDKTVFIVELDDIWKGVMHFHFIRKKMWLRIVVKAQSDKAPS